MTIDTFAEEIRRAEYISRFNKVIDYVQANLSAPLSLDTLASQACFSPYHFHRLFHAWMGETAHDFILRLRLERAAVHLTYDAHKSITEIALECGFASSSAFARAFKSLHRISASEWRAKRKICKTDRKKGEELAAPSLRYSTSEIGLGPFREQTVELRVDVKHFEPMHVAYVRHMGPFQQNAKLFEHLFGRLARWAGPRGLMGTPFSRVLSVHHDNPDITDPHRLRLDAAVAVPEDTRVSGEIGKQRLEGGAYAVAKVRIRPNQYTETWDALMAGWLPGSGYQPDDRPCLEIYLNDPKSDPEGMHEVEICLAVKPL
ncbi:MAG TPA: GyrI-like domain-containing protein [Thermoanaerobaculia bacterium]